MSAFVPLRVRSQGSLLYGTASPQALIAHALEQGYETLALTDFDALYLAIPFFRGARPEGLQPILGAEVTPAGHAPWKGPAATTLLLAHDRRGYANLCRVLTARRLDPRFDVVRALEDDASGLQVIVESPGLAAALLGAGVPPAAGVVPRGRGERRAGGLWLGLRGLAGERPQLADRAAAARRLGLPLVATGEVAMLHPRDHGTHRVAVAAAANDLLERMPAAAFAPREAWLAAPLEWERRVRAACVGAGVPEAADEALRNNAALAARCRLELEMGVPIFPQAPLPAGETGRSRLARLAREGLRRRYGGDPLAAHARLRGELEMIDRLGFTDYFVLVANIVEFARARGIATVGRGSGASSIVSYVLGITNVDPIRHGLHFERFLNPSRRDCPDLDIDLCWKRREEVIAHVYETYGHDRVATISTHATLSARSAFRDAARALGVPMDRVNALSRRIPRELDPPYLRHLEALPGSRGLPWHEPPIADALAHAERLAGSVRHLSVHCGGIVIADRPLTWYVPLERAAKDVVVTQYEMRAIEQIGLVKMDLLGNRALSTIGTCVELARARGAEVCVDDIPETDAATAARLAAGDTLNGFQLESPAMRHLLRMLRCATLDEVIVAVALIRPGAAGSGMKESYVRRRHGLEPVTFLHPALEPVLGEAHGLMLYEEDVMRVAHAVAGLTLAEGDDLRRAIGGARGDDEFRALEHGFVAHAVANGVAPDPARAVWQSLTRFAAYAFCKAHAAGYGTLGWHSVWLKERFPAEWAVGVLEHHAGMYPTWVHVEDLRRRGVGFLAPCVNRSEWESALEERNARDDGVLTPAADPLAASPPRGTVRIGLSRVFGLAGTTGARIVARRRARPFRSLADFVDRVRPTPPELEALILAGALDATGRTRPALLLEARVAAGLASASPARARRAPVGAPALTAPDGGTLAPEPVAPVAIAELPEFDRAARVHGECRATGLWFSGHPLEHLAKPGARAGTARAAGLERLVGRRVALAGLACAMRRVETKDGGTMLFLTLADETGLAECVLFPPAYRMYARQVAGAQALRVEGKVEESLGAVTLTVDRVAPVG